jgi:oligopeptide transport system substrate-binding protein
MISQLSRTPPKCRLSRRSTNPRSSSLTFAIGLLLVLCATLAGCLGGHRPSIYYGKNVVPRTQEFRWSDGGLPQTFDPAFAAAPPDTDAVRALFEGLTDYDPRTLATIPGVATRWESSADGRVWTFYLRQDARWSNGESVIADDFVRSWKRTLKIGPLAPHTELLANIEGSKTGNALPKPGNQLPGHLRTNVAGGFGAEALGDHILRVRLRQADESFPALVAHPVFRPVKIADANATRPLEAHDLVSNGAFLLSGTENDRVLLERAKTYWDGDSVALQRVAFVSSTNAEDALTAYRAGDVDAVTNAPFEPLALKLLAPYKDFRRSTFGALTYYDFNTARAPFDDIRVREALALAIDRERVSRDHLGGATEPAGKFLPEALSGEKPVVGQAELLEQDLVKARELLAEADFPDGKGFPVVRLLINRNEQQRVVAQAIAAMWRSALNIETEIIIRNWDEYELAIRAGEYDVVRRGMVMQTTDELSNLRILFERDPQSASGPDGTAETAKTRDGTGHDSSPQTTRSVPVVVSEVQALKELKAMPIYFASSYALVKPYVSGFDTNVLDAPSLKRTRLDSTWAERRP